MKKFQISLLVLLALFMVSCAPKYTLNHSKLVKPINLPADDAAHYWAQNEWWYYTGHLKAEDGRDFGYEVTFFKRVTSEDNVPEFFIPIPAYWFKDVGLLGHFAVTDLNKGTFQADQIHNFLFNKSKADDKKYDVMIDTWTAREENGKHILSAEMKGYKVDLALEPVKPAAYHGKDGIADKGANHSNYYYSYTDMKTTGTLTIDGKPVKVTGTTWMDHEYGTMKLNPPQSGWDWFSFQLDNKCELMIYVIRNDRDKLIDIAGGTFVLPDGKTIWLKQKDLNIKNLSYWYSKKTDSNYPASWDITVDPLKLKLNIVPMMAEQEVALKPIPYWEGTVQVTGTYDNLPVKGKGYVELTGYSKKYPLAFF